jgi:hypothetical protein
MQLKPGSFCPLIKKECAGIQCAWFTKVAGYDMNTGKEVEEWQCAIAWMPMLMIENSGQQRQTGAAVESFRNEMIKAQIESQKVLLQTAVLNNPPSPNQIDITPTKPKLVRGKK